PLAQVCANRLAAGVTSPTLEVLSSPKSVMAMPPAAISVGPSIPIMIRSVVVRAIEASCIRTRGQARKAISLTVVPAFTTHQMQTAQKFEPVHDISNYFFQASRRQASKLCRGSENLNRRHIRTEPAAFHRYEASAG